MSELNKELFEVAEFNEFEAEKTGYSNYSYWYSTFRTFFNSKLSTFLLVLMLILVTMSFLYPIISRIDPNKLALDITQWNVKPNSIHWFGTDGLGRDIWARTWYGTRTSLKLSLIVALFDVGIGTIVGAVWGKELRNLRQNIQMIFQDPMASLNERAKIDDIISEGLHNYKLYKNEKDRKKKVSKALISVGLFPDFASRFPHEFSGGQRQRIGIARALIMEPQFVIADEPISALDVSIRAQVINLLNKLKKEHDLTYLFIAHDLSVIRFISDRIAVIYKGRIVELAESEELYNNPIHPYTKSLLSAIPIPDPDLEKDKVLYEYNPGLNNYDKNPPKWVEINEGHFIWANDEEIIKYREEFKYS